MNAVRWIRKDDKTDQLHNSQRCACSCIHVFVWIILMFSTVLVEAPTLKLSVNYVADLFYRLLLST